MNNLFGVEFSAVVRIAFDMSWTFCLYFFYFQSWHFTHSLHAIHCKKIKGLHMRREKKIDRETKGKHE